MTNERAEAVTVSVLVRYLDDGDLAFDRTLTVPAGEERTVNNEVVRGTNCEVEVAVDGGPSTTHRWRDVSGPLWVTVSSGEIAVEAGSPDSGA